MIKNKWLIIFVLLMGIFVVRKFFFKNWAPYYKKKLYQPPRALIVAASSHVNNSLVNPFALDLGIGAGNDAAYLFPAQKTLGF